MRGKGVEEVRRIGRRGFGEGEVKVNEKRVSNRSRGSEKI